MRGHTVNIPQQNQSMRGFFILGRHVWVGGVKISACQCSSGVCVVITESKCECRNVPACLRVYRLLDTPGSSVIQMTLTKTGCGCVVGWGVEQRETGSPRLTDANNSDADDRLFFFPFFSPLVSCRKANTLWRFQPHRVTPL